MKIQPTITPKAEISVTVQQDLKANQYFMVAVNPDGTEKPNSEFTVSLKGFEKHYKHLTAAPEGTATLPQFVVKKKN